MSATVEIVCVTSEYQQDGAQFVVAMITALTRAAELLGAFCLARIQALTVGHMSRRKKKSTHKVAATIKRLAASIDTQIM